MTTHLAPLAAPLAFLLSIGCAAQPAPRLAEPPAVTVIASWEATSAARMAASVAAPLEAELRTITGVRRILSQCTDKSCTILLQLDDPARATEAAFLAGAAVRRAEPKLPRGAHALAYAADVTRPPDFTLALILDVKDVTPDHYTAVAQFAHKLMQFPDTVRYEIQGMPETRISVEVDPDRAKALGIDPADVQAAIEAQVVAVDEHTRIILGDRPGAAGDISRIFIKRAGQPPVALSSVATVRKIVAPAALYRVDGEPAVLVNIFLRSGTTDADLDLCLRRILDERAPAPIKRVIALRVRTH